MAQSIANVTRIAPLTQAYVTDLAKFGANATQTKSALAALNTAEQQAQRLTQQAGNAASQAAGQFAQATAAAHDYARALNSINGTKVETLYVVTNFVSTGYAGPGGVGHRVGGGAHGGAVTGGSGIIPSFAGGGALPGFAPGVDSILAALSPGEAILNPYAARALGSGVSQLAEHHRHGTAAGRRRRGERRPSGRAAGRWRRTTSTSTWTARKSTPPSSRPATRTRHGTGGPHRPVYSWPAGRLTGVRLRPAPACGVQLSRSRSCGGGCRSMTECPLACRSARGVAHRTLDIGIP